MAESSLDSFRGKLRKYPLALEILVIFLLVGVFYFGVKGAMVLSLKTTTPMMGVTSRSMTHPDDFWKGPFRGRVEDVSELPFQDGVQLGDLVIVQGVGSPDDIEIGDVIIWWDWRRDLRIIHRVYDIGEDREGWYCITKGDNNPGPDDPKIRMGDIVGKAVFSIPYLGYPSVRF